MSGKKAGTRFSIQLSRTDPAHLRAADILNGKERYEKAQYIVDAVLYYERRGDMPEEQRPAVVDEKYIEAVVSRILRDREKDGAGTLPDAAPVGKAENISLPDAEINFDEAVEALGDDGFNAIAGALDMFRRK